MIGVDLVKVSRIEGLMKRFGDKALDKFLNSNEQKIANNTNTIAGFFAAKEAFSKALGTGIGSDCSFFDIEIQKTSKGAPFLSISDDILKKYNIIDTSVSITHDGGFAMAIVVLEVTNDK